MTPGQPPPTGNPWAGVARDLGVLASFLTQPKIEGSYLNELRGAIREFATVLALRRLEMGLDHLGRPADYPVLDRCLARETVAAMHVAKHGQPAIAA